MTRSRVRADLAVICGRCDTWPVEEDGPRIRGRMVCRTCYALWQETPEGITAAQIADAAAALDRDATDYLSWPWADVDTIAGPMAPGQPYFFCGFSGNGKTTFSWSAVQRWATAGVPGYVLPLETRDYEWRTGLACVTLGIPPGLALSGKLRMLADAGDEDATRARAMIRAELHEQEERWGDTLHVSPLRGVTLTALEREVEHAARLGCRYVLVDHIDHITPDDYKSQVAESQRVNRALVEIASRHDIVLVCASQLNMEVVKGDALAKYQPPRLSHLMFPAVKTQVAAGIYGLYRPVADDVDPEQLSRAKRGECEPGLVLKPNAMGVVVMKARHQHGDVHEGARCQLTVRSGRVLTAEEWEATWVAPPGPRPVRSAHPERPQAA